jgi:hypothetical protein
MLESVVDIHSRVSEQDKQAILYKLPIEDKFGKIERLTGAFIAQETVEYWSASSTTDKDRIRSNMETLEGNINKLKLYANGGKVEEPGSGKGKKEKEDPKATFIELPPPLSLPLVDRKGSLVPAPDSDFDDVDKFIQTEQMKARVTKEIKNLSQVWQGQNKGKKRRGSVGNNTQKSPSGARRGSVGDSIKLAVSDEITKLSKALNDKSAAGRRGSVDSNKPTTPKTPGGRRGSI